MTWVEYKYSGEFSEVVGNIVYRPIIGVKIKYGNETEETIAMIDSGTDVTVVDSNLAKLLGIDSTKYKKCKVAGVTGEAKGFVAKIKISIENFDDEEFEIEVCFVDDMKSNILLGQRDLFEKFKIKFEKSKNKFYLNRDN